MESNDLKRATQSILDTSYKLYSDVSLINSSLFRAASALGVELKEIPKISLAMTKEKVSSNPIKTTNPQEKISEGKKIALFGFPKPKVNKEEVDNKDTFAYKSTQTATEEHIKDIENKGQKVNKIANELPSKVAFKPENISQSNSTIVATSQKKEETKESLEEKENKLNSLQGKATKLEVKETIEKPEVSPFEAVSLEKQFNPNSNSQKKVFEVQNAANKEENEEEALTESNPLNNLLKLVKEKHSITITQAAQTLNVNRDLIERWAKILTQSSLIRIKYQLMGDAILEA